MSMYDDDIVFKYFNALPNFKTMSISDLESLKDKEALKLKQMTDNNVYWIERLNQARILQSIEDLIKYQKELEKLHNGEEIKK